MLLALELALWHPRPPQCGLHPGLWGHSDKRAPSRTGLEVYYHLVIPMTSFTFTMEHTIDERAGYVYESSRPLIKPWPLDN